jgi:hypothetical protein
MKSFVWLDRREARECGDGVACFSYQHPADLLADLVKDLRANVRIDDKRNRIYIIRLENGTAR